MCLNMTSFCLWLLLTVALSALLTVVVQLKLTCGEFTSFDSSDCLPSMSESEGGLPPSMFCSLFFLDYTFINQICGRDLETLCGNVSCVCPLPFPEMRLFIFLSSFVIGWQCRHCVCCYFVFYHHYSFWFGK